MSYKLTPWFNAYRCLALNALSSSSSSACCFFGALSGFFLPPSLPDIVNIFKYKLLNLRQNYKARLLCFSGQNKAVLNYFRLGMELFFLYSFHFSNLLEVNKVITPNSTAMPDLDIINGVSNRKLH